MQEKRMYKTIFRPTMYIHIYIVKHVQSQKKEQNKIQIWERKTLKKIYEVWEIQTNKELYELFNEPNIYDIVQSKRLQ